MLRFLFSIFTYSYLLAVILWSLYYRWLCSALDMELSRQASLLPELAHLVDLRHSDKYTTVYAIGDFAQCLARGGGN